MEITPENHAVRLESADMYTQFYGFTFISIITLSDNYPQAIQALSEIGTTIYESSRIRLTAPNNPRIEDFVTIHAILSTSTHKHRLHDIIRNNVSGPYISDVLTVNDAITVSTRSSGYDTISAYITDEMDTVFTYPLSADDSPCELVYSLHTSRTGLASILGNPEYNMERQSAVCYIHSRQDGHYYGRTYAQAITSDAKLNNDIRHLTKDKLYKLALITNAYGRLFGDLSAATFDSFVDTYHIFEPFAKRIDTKLDWDGISPLPIPASDSELEAMFLEGIGIHWNENLVI